MAYQQGTASSISDLVSKLFTFLTANGWTQDVLDTTNGEAAIHRNNIYISFRWATSSPEHLAIYQALGYVGTRLSGTADGSGGSSTVLVATGDQFVTNGTEVGDPVQNVTQAETVFVVSVDSEDQITTTALASGDWNGDSYAVRAAPGNHTDDSGVGEIGPTDTNLQYTMGANGIGDGPFPAYYFFESDYYCHVVLEYSTNRFRHFGFGALDKIGDWTGGEYAYGTYWGNSSYPIWESSFSCLLDGRTSGGSTTAKRSAALRLQSFPNQPVGGKWGLFNGAGRVTLGNDRGDTGRVNIQGGFRSGPQVAAYGWLPANISNGFKPESMITAWYVNTEQTPDRVQKLGHMPDVRQMSHKGYEPGEEFTIASDTWMVFPASRKQYTGEDVDESWNLGVAYKKVTA